jgi:cytochrome b subunit of formate dehydrogenase
MVPVVMLTGLVMTVGWPSPVAVSWAVPLHFTAVGLVVSRLVIHVYMAAVFPEEKPAFFSMITGSVDELYAHNHHFKWWREEKEKQLARRAAREAALAAADGAAADATDSKDANELGGNS